MAAKKISANQNNSPMGSEAVATSDKATPYPFDISVVAHEGAPPVLCDVLRLTPVGLLMRVKKEHHFKVGDNHTTSFALPGTPYRFHETMKVVKTYDSLDAESPKKLVKHYTVEAHFRGLTSEKRKQILNFLQAIKQK